MAELELYLALNLLAGQEGDDADRVKSRLLDALLDEKALQGEAERRGIKVSSLEIAAYLSSDLERRAGNPSSFRARSEGLVRQRLIVQKLLDQLASEQPEPTDGEVLDRVRETRERNGSAKRVRLRVLGFESAEQATEAHDRIKSGRMTFAEAVQSYERDPGQGIPVELAWDGLEDAVKQALSDLEPGEVAVPVASHGETFLFQLEGWPGPGDALDPGALARAREDLSHERSRAAKEALVSRLHAAAPIELHTERLPFRYVRDDGG